MASDNKALPALGVIFAIASIGAGGYYLTHRSATVHFVNALDEPVHISVGELDFDLLKDQQAEHSLPKGPHRVRVAFAGKSAKDDAANSKILEEEQIDVPGGVDCAIYNIAGAAPLFRSTVTYSSGATNEKEVVEIISGPRFFTNNDTNYVFKDPPKSISLGKGQTRAVHHMVGRVPNADWIDSIIMLAKQDQKPLAVEVATRIAMLHPESLDHVSKVVYALGLAGLSEATPDLARRLVAAAPHSLEAHRFYQGALAAEGKRDLLIAEYQKRLEADPSSPEAVYLLLRVLPRGARLPRVKQALEAFPDDPKLNYSLLMTMVDSHQPAGGDAVIAKLKGLKLDPIYRRAAEEAAASLRVETGRTKLALAELDRNAVGPVFVGRLQRLAGQPVDAGLTSLNDPLRSAYANLYLAGEGATKTSAQEENPQIKAFLALTERVKQGQTATVGHYQTSKLEPASVQSLGAALVYPLVAALAKRGATKDATNLMATMGMSEIAQPALLAMVMEGKESPELEEADHETRAALRVALAVHTDDKAKQKALLTAALADEPIPGLVHLVAKSWF